MRTKIFGTLESQGFLPINTCRPNTNALSSNILVCQRLYCKKRHAEQRGWEFSFLPSVTISLTVVYLSLVFRTLYIHLASYRFKYHSCSSSWSRWVTGSWTESKNWYVHVKGLIHEQLFYEKLICTRKRLDTGTTILRKIPLLKNWYVHVKG